MAKFQPVFTRPRTPEMDNLTKEELIELLPASLRQQVVRCETSWAKIDELAGEEVFDPATGQPVRETRFTKAQILMLFDPPMEDDLSFTKEENYLKYVNSDPVVWARVYLSINPRIYQILVLRDSSDWLLLRFGRRCLAGDTPILLESGEWKKLSEIKLGDNVVSYDKNKMVIAPVVDKVSNGYKDVYRIRLSNGLAVDATDNHEFLAIRNIKKSIHDPEWMSVKSGLTVGMDLHVMKGYGIFGNINAEHEAKLLGYLLTDGYIAGKSDKCATQTPKFTNNNQLYIDEVVESSKVLFGYDCTIRIHQSGKIAQSVYITDGKHDTGNLCSDWLSRIGLLGLKSYYKILHKECNSWDKRSIALLINRMFSGDGCASVWNSSGRAGAGELSLTSCSYEILETVRLLLLKFGVTAIIVRERTRNNWKLRISDRNSINNFFSEIGYIYGKEDKCSELENAIAKRSRNLNTGVDDFRFARIKSIEKIGQQEVFDIAVADTNNFIANGIVTHNCGKTTALAIRMLFRSWTRPGCKSLLVAPMKVHAAVTWDMIRSFMRACPELLEEQKQDSFRMVEAPNYRIEFSNGSMIQLFTSGVRSRGKADVLRGQEGDDIYVDEVDLMGLNDFAGFVAILRDTGRGQKTMIAASTPNGRRDMMYKFSTDMSSAKSVHGAGFVEYYFPAHADVHYSAKNDEQMRMLHSHNQYLHEILALYGEEAAGVFLKGQIERACSHYPDGYLYHKLQDGIYQRDSFSKIAVGVDWDKYGAGTNIVVLRLDTRDIGSEGDSYAGRVMVIARFEIPRGMTTLSDGMDMIKEVNFFFNPDFIYADRGYGETQLELLGLEAKKGQNIKARGLDTKLKGIAFNEALTIHDPITHQPINKEVKDFMVTLMVRLLEQDRMILNCNDVSEVPGNTDLTKQYEQYLVVGQSITGKNRYEAGNPEVGDHALDATMLAALAFEVEYGAFSLNFKQTHPVVLKKNLYETLGASKINMGTDTVSSGIDLKHSVLSRTNVDGKTRRRAGRLAIRRSNI
jgi:hypothetical protein